MIGPHEPDDQIECCQGDCPEADACGCGACVCESCNPEGAHFLGCDQGVGTAEPIHSWQIAQIALQP